MKCWGWGKGGARGKIEHCWDNWLLAKWGRWGAGLAAPSALESRFPPPSPEGSHPVRCDAPDSSATTLPAERDFSPFTDSMMRC